MNEYFSSQRDNLEGLFRTTLDEMMSIYADSKIDDDGRVEIKMDEIKGIIGQMTRLRDSIVSQIQDADKSLTIASSRVYKKDELTDELESSNASNMVLTADQQMNDAKSLYDHHRILLFVKVVIILLIFVKGNDIYDEYRQVFVGASLACMFVYIVFTFFF